MPVPRLCSNHAFPVQIEIFKSRSKSRKKIKTSTPKNTPPGDALLQPVIFYKYTVIPLLKLHRDNPYAVSGAFADPY